VLLQHSTDGALTAAVLALFEYLVAHSHALLQRLPAGDGATVIPFAAFGHVNDDASGAGSKAALAPYEQLMSLLEEFCMLQQATRAAASEAAATAGAFLVREHSSVRAAEQAALEPLEAVSWLQFRSFFEAVDRTFGTAELCALLAALYPPGITAVAPPSMQQQTQQQRVEAWAPELRVAALLDADALQAAAVAAEEAGVASPGAAFTSQVTLPLALRTCPAAAVAGGGEADAASSSGATFMRPAPATLAVAADPDTGIAAQPAPVPLTAVAHAAEHPSNLVPALRQAAYLLARASEAALALQRLTQRPVRAAAAATVAAAATGAQSLPAPTLPRAGSGDAAGATSEFGARAADRWLLLRVHARSAVARALLSGCPPVGLAAASPRFLGRGLATAAPLQPIGATAHAAAALATPAKLSSIVPAAAGTTEPSACRRCAGGAVSRGKRASVRKTAARATAAASSTASDGSRSAEARVVVYRPTPHRRYSPVGPGSVPRFLEYVAAQQAEQAEARKAETTRALVAAAASSKLKRSGSGVILRL
jgi:hypothetical protein